MIKLININKIYYQFYQIIIFFLLIYISLKEKFQIIIIKNYFSNKKLLLKPKFDIIISITKSINK